MTVRRAVPPSTSYVRWLSDLGSGDVDGVGGKNASLGEMIGRLGRAGIRVPDGFAVTAEAYWRFLDDNDLRDAIRHHLGQPGGESPPGAGRELRRLVGSARLPDEVVAQVGAAYHELGERAGRAGLDVAVRSSATAEDLPEASFAGQQDTFLNIREDKALVDAVGRCYASLFTDRAIAYRQDQGFDHMTVALSVGVQQMVRADKAGAGVMFSMDTETGFPRTVLVNAAWGLGESVVRGTVDPDEHIVFKPLLDHEGPRPIISKSQGGKAYKTVYSSSGHQGVRTVRTSGPERRSYVLEDAEVLELARWAVVIEDHYGRAMDIEWAKDGHTGELFVVQARPETVQARRGHSSLKTYHLEDKGGVLLRGLAVGDAIAAGKVCSLAGPEAIDDFVDGSVLVTEMTDPDWVPIMRRAAAIVTDHGGRTSHVAIVSRELNIPAVVGTGQATHVLDTEQEVTVSCAEGAEGRVYTGTLPYREDEVDLDSVAITRTKVMLNLAEPTAAFRWWRLPADGVGLARMEFIVSDHIKVHPMALARFDDLEDARARREISKLTEGFADKGSTSSRGSPTGSPGSPPPDGPTPWWYAPATSRPTSTPSSSVGGSSSPTRRTQCSAGEVPAATTPRATGRASPWSAEPCARCAMRSA